MKQIIYLLLFMLLTACNGSREMIIQAIYLPEEIIYVDYNDLTISFEGNSGVRYFESLEQLINTVEEITAYSLEYEYTLSENVFMVYIEDGNVFFEYAYNFPGQNQVTYVLDGTDGSLSTETITNTLDVFYGEGNYSFEIR